MIPRYNPRIGSFLIFFLDYQTNYQIFAIKQFKDIYINSEYFYKPLSSYFILKFYLKSIIFEYEDFNPTILFYFIKPILKKF